MSLSNKGGAVKEISEVHSIHWEGAIVSFFFFSRTLLAKYIRMECFLCSWKSGKAEKGRI